MDRQVYHYRFNGAVSLGEVEESLLLAVLAAESLYGRSPVRLDAAFCLDRDKRSCVVDAGSEVGRAIARIFTGFVTRQFGEDAFRVERGNNGGNAMPDPHHDCGERGGSAS